MSRVRMIAAGVALLVLGTGAAVLISSSSTPPDSGPGAAAAARIVAGCRGQRAEARTACYGDSLGARLEAEGLPAAIAALRALARRDRRIEREGHIYAHGLGIGGYLRSGSVSETFGACTTEFSSGCHHGVIQAYLESRDSIDSTAVNQLCAPYRAVGQPRWLLFQCVHGTGHGLQMMYHGDLPRSLATCDLLVDDWDRASCFGGAFMENIMKEIAPHHPASELSGDEHHSTFKALDSADLRYPCSILTEERYLRPCYEIQTSAMLHFTSDLDRVAEACDGAPEAMRPVCHQSLGRDITSRTLRDPGKTLRLCRASGEQAPWCYFGAVKAIVDWSAEPSDGLEFCRRVGNRPGWSLCYRAVGEQLAALEPSEAKRAAVCARARGDWAGNACRFGAGVGPAVPPDDARGPE